MSAAGGGTNPAAVSGATTSAAGGGPTTSMAEGDATTVAESPADPARRLPFGDDVVQAILGHMRDDHAADGVVIVGRNGAPDAVTATMTGFDALETFWHVADADGTERDVTIPWPSPVTDRPSVRRLVVELFED